MFIGDTGKRGLHHLVWEVLDNSVDEAMAGYCSQINIILDADGETISVEDNGRGIPVEIHPEEGRSTLEIVLTVLHAGGKFGGSGYEASGGLHGVGVSCVNALSDYLRATVRRDGGEHLAEFCRGDLTRPAERVGDSRKRGTTITFHPDTQIFTAGVVFDEDMLVRRFRETAFLNAGLTIKFVSKKSGRKEEFCFAGGIADYATYLTSARTGQYPSHPFYFESKSGKTQVQVAFQYSAEDDESILTFANNINTVDGGTHLSGFKTALTRVVNTFARSSGAVKEKEPNLAGDDIREGVTAVISVRLPQPQFEGQTKAKLGSVEVEGVVNSLFAEALTEYFEKNPGIVKQIVERAMIAQRARDAAKKQSELIKRKSFLGKSNRLPGKLKDCNSEDRTQTELFIVEGDSAAGCKIGSTKIRLTDGRELSIANIMHEQESGAKHFCYTIQRDGSVGIGHIVNVRVTKRNAELVKVILDNGQKIIGTPCHPYMLRDGSYKRADELQEGESLMPLYTQISDATTGKGLSGCEQVWNPKTNQWRFTHILVDEFNLSCGVYEPEDNEHRHHVDFKKLNNNPDDISRMDAKAHLQLQRDHKVVYVEYLAYTEDVYDLEVPGTHNFALAAGVFVHNSAEDGRDAEFQAVLPLRGKIINAEKNDIVNLLKNQEVQNLIAAIGAGVDIGEGGFNLENRRYDKIILLTDADVDGSHIATLLLTFLYRFMRPLLLGGHVYLAQPPFYKVISGKANIYCWTDSERDKALAKAGAKGKLVRFKGLGEMDFDELGETTLHRATRHLVRVNVPDTGDADHMLSVLMGRNVSLRKEHIVSKSQGMDLGELL